MELGMVYGVQVGKHKRELHLISKLELVLASENTVEEVVPKSSMVKHSCWNKAKMSIIKAKRKPKRRPTRLKRQPI